MTNPYRALCAELVDDLEMSDWPSKLKEAFRADIARARALLDQPEPEGPTDEEIMELMPQQMRAFAGGHSIRHGIAAVLLHLADAEADCGAVPVYNIEDLADALTAPTLLERAMAGDATAAKQFLHEAGFTDKQGQWLPQYQPIPEALDD